MKSTMVLLLFALLGCGSNAHRALTTAESSGTPLTISGFVSAVRLTRSATNSGSSSLVTVVTFIPPIPQNSSITRITFCGNVANEFITSSFVTVAFAQGSDCSTIVSLTPNRFVSISGVVSIVQLTALADNSFVTIVTFIPPSPQNGLAETISFCGAVENKFLLNAFMTVNFTQGQGCSSLLSVALG